MDLAWQWREKSKILERLNAVRIFHGKGEGQGPWQAFSVDKWSNHYWITEWESQFSEERLQTIREQIIQFLRKKGAHSVVGILRPEGAVPSEVQTLWGEPPEGRTIVCENENQFLIQLEGTRHPGLFLDHEPLRRWLGLNMDGLEVLNTFCYTGSLSVAAARGGAKKVTSIDLSAPTMSWAKENLALNGFLEPQMRLITGDVFDWLERFKKQKQSFDCIILDPPSFSRGKKGHFSTFENLEALHRLAISLLNPEGYLVTSINSAKVNQKKYESEILAAAAHQKVSLQLLRTIELPETFPTPFGQNLDRYLKGWILRRRG